MRRALRNNGLTIVFVLLFAVCLVGQFVAGWRRHNEDEIRHGQPAIGGLAYLKSPDFLEATFENWESEFLQMALFVVFTALLYQKGSAESKELPGEKKADKPVVPSKIPRPARTGGARRWLYEHSLSLSLLLLFGVSFAGHAISGRRAYNEHATEHGGAAIGLLEYAGSSQFWFESFQNWQSEFLSIAVIVVLTIWLREKDSTQSKKVDAPHSQTGH